MADSYKALLQQDNHKQTEQHKDKLVARKQNEADLKDKHKQELEAQKQKKAEEQHAASQAYKMERSWNTVVSKRAAREQRVAERAQERKAEGQMCEHGIWKCKICFPHKTGK